MLASLLRRFEPFTALEWTTLCSVARHARLLRCAAQRTLAPSGRERRGSCYVVEGTVRRRSKEGRSEQISADDPSARRPLLIVGDGASIETLCAVELLWIDIDPVAFMLRGADASVYSVDAVAATDGHWMHRFVARGIVESLSPSGLQAVFRAFTSKAYRAGDAIVREGEPAEQFFVIASGSAEVRRGGRRVASLVPGDCAGADALVSGTHRNATVVMISDGRTMSLPAPRFERLLFEPLVHWIDGPVAGCRELDLSTRSRGPDALRALVGELDLAATYVFTGGSAGERALAVFLAAQRGIRAFARN